jgi:hypothetical protein
MKPKTIPVISITSFDFEQIAAMSNKEAIEHLFQVCRLSSKPIIPKKVKYEAARVSRGPGRVTVHLCLNGNDTARVSFVPSPPFNLVR